MLDCSCKQVINNASDVFLFSSQVCGVVGSVIFFNSFLRNIPFRVVVLSQMKSKQFLQLVVLPFLILGKVNAQGFLKFQISEKQTEIYAYQDSNQILGIKNLVLNQFQSQGFVSSWLDKTKRIGDTCFFQVHVGKKYVWKDITYSQKLAGLKIKFDWSSHLRPQELEENIIQILTHYENVGYPFASCFLDSVEIKNDSVSAEVRVEKGPLILFDSLEVKGDAAIKRETLERLLNFKKGRKYTEAFVKNLPGVISSLSFLSMVRKPEVYFSPGKATLVLYLTSQKNNRFDGVIGLNPNENREGVEIVGEVDVELRNVLKRAETIGLSWEKIKENSQRFKLRIQYPFLFSTRIGLNTKLNYFRQDTAFANLLFEAGISYFIDNNQSFGVGWTAESSNSLASISELTSVPISNSFSSHYLNVTFNNRQLDYAFNPTRGFELAFEINSGIKTIVKQEGYTNESYESLTDRTRQFKLNVDFSKFVPLFKKATALIRFSGGSLLGDNIFVNELYQLGGLNSLRGFNQQSIFASNFYFMTTEFRYLFDRNSAIFSFIEGGFYESNQLNNYKNGFPIGAGIGVNFATKSGVFTLTYALGKQNNNPLLFRNGKVHFGYISIF